MCYLWGEGDGIYPNRGCEMANWYAVDKHRGVTVADTSTKKAVLALVAKRCNDPFATTTRVACGLYRYDPPAWSSRRGPIYIGRPEALGRVVSDSELVARP